MSECAGPDCTDPSHLSEEKPTVTPAELFAKAAEEKKEVSPEEQASQQFASLLPIFLRKLDSLGGNATKRVFRNLVEYPLNSRDLKFLAKNEEEVFVLGLQLLSANRIITDAALKELHEKQKQANVEKEANNSQKEGEANVTETI